MRKIIFAEKDMNIEERYEGLVYDLKNLLSRFTEIEMTMEGTIAKKTYKTDEDMLATMSKTLLKELTPLLDSQKTIILVGTNILVDFLPLLSKTLLKYRYRSYQYDNNPKYNSKVTKIDSISYAVENNWVDFNHYNTIHHIGDIHGCYTALRNYIKSDILPLDELFIFTGDLLERGIENMEVLKYLLTIYKLPNVIILEGNHETHLANYVFGIKESSRNFSNTIVPLIEAEKIKKSSLKEFCKNLTPYITYKKGDKKVIVTHGGVTGVVEDFGSLPSNIAIRGVGNYSTPVESLFNKNILNMEDSSTSGFEHYQVHGHRNLTSKPISNGRTFNLEGGIEKGGHLRVVVLADDTFTPVAIKNDVFAKRVEDLDNEVITTDTSISDLVTLFRANKMIKESTTIGDVSSFNFSREVFYNGLWTSQTNHARGIHINTKLNKIVARGFDKFFNLGEESNIQSKVSYPAISFTKLNGYLALCGVNEDEFYLSTKSVVDSDLVSLFTALFDKTFDDSKKAFIKEFITSNDCTLVFEVLSPSSDPHVIKYAEEKIVLLNVVRNTVMFDTLSWDIVSEFASMVGVELAGVDTVIENKEEFTKYVDTVTKENIFDLNTEHIEGYVIRFENGYMTKIKLPYYVYWKSIRSSVSNIFTKLDKATKKGIDTSEIIKNIGVNNYTNVYKETHEIITLAYNMFKDDFKYRDFDVIDFMSSKELKDLVSTFEYSDELLFKTSLKID